MADVRYLQPHEAKPGAAIVLNPQPHAAPGAPLQLPIRPGQTFDDTRFDAPPHVGGGGGSWLSYCGDLLYQLHRTLVPFTKSDLFFPTVLVLVYILYQIIWYLRRPPGPTV